MPVKKTTTPAPASPASSSPPPVTPPVTASAPVTEPPEPDEPPETAPGTETAGQEPPFNIDQYEFTVFRGRRVIAFCETKDAVEAAFNATPIRLRDKLRVFKRMKAAQKTTLEIE